MANNQSTTTGYVPGVCNINRAEIAYRKKAGYFGVALTIVIAIVIFVLPVSRWFQLVNFVPAFIAAIGFLQAKNRFCVSYAASGQQNASDGSKKASAIEDQTARSADKARARKMNLQAAAIAAVTALVLVAINFS